MTTTKLDLNGLTETLRMARHQAEHHEGMLDAAVDLDQLEQLIAAARRLEEVNAVVRALGAWAQRQQAGEVCWPQPMHDGTLRIYASKCAGTTPDVAQGADFLETAKSLCERLGIGWDPKAKDGG